MQNEKQDKGNKTEYLGKKNLFESTRIFFLR